MDYDTLLRLLNIPDGLDRNKKKEVIPKPLREEIYERDKMSCQICGRNTAEILHIHHIIPNGSATPGNLILLCNHCHKAVHLLLYTSKKWKYCSYNLYTYY